MRTWKAILVTVVTMNVESVDSIHTLKFFKAVEWYFAGSGDKLKQLRTFLLVEGTDCTPEPLDLRGGS